MKTVNVTIWSDFVCPWCWIAKRRFDRAVAALNGEVEVVVTAKAYRLAKGTTPIDYTRALHGKFGNPAAADQMMAAVAENGRQEGLVYNFPTMRFGDTSDAHALLKSIADIGVRERVSERLYRAATTDGLDIFDREMLLALAAEAGAVDLAVDFASPDRGEHRAGRGRGKCRFQRCSALRVQRSLLRRAACGDLREGAA
jgi:predicted DsbA family dithiol-disulfide isomerase